MQYAVCLKKYCNAVDGTFYDAIKIDRTVCPLTFALFLWDVGVD